MSEPQRIPMKGLEFDALTRFHHYVHWRPGERKAAKRKYHRRWRKQARRELRRDIIIHGRTF